MTKYISTAVVAASIGAYLHFKLSSPIVLEKKAEVEKVVTKTDTRVVTKVIERPDGTKETVIESTDKTIKNEDSSKLNQVNKPKLPKTTVIATASASDLGELKRPVLGLLVEHKLLGGFGIAAGLNEKGVISLGIGFSF